MPNPLNHGASRVCTTATLGFVTSTPHADIDELSNSSPNFLSSYSSTWESSRGADFLGFRAPSPEQVEDFLIWGFSRGADFIRSRAPSPTKCGIPPRGGPRGEMISFASGHPLPSKCRIPPGGTLNIHVPQRKTLRRGGPLHGDYVSFHPLTNL